MNISMHVENESGGVYKLRERPSESLRKTRAYDATGPTIDDYVEQFCTPESCKTSLNDSHDSGFSSSLEIGSDPDWFLRPRRPRDPRVISSFSVHDHDNSTVVTPPKMQKMFRPSYVDYRVSKFPILTVERIIVGFIFIILMTSACFGLLISARFFESSQMELHGKYKSLQYGNTIASRKSVDVESSDHIEPQIDFSRTKAEVADSSSHIPSISESIPHRPRKKLRRSKNYNPLIVKSKPSMSRVRKLIRKSFENDYEDPKFRGGVPDTAIDSFENDYDLPSFRSGKINPELENDYDIDPSFRGGKPDINHDYDTDPSFRGKNIFYSDKHEGVVDLMGSVY